MIERVLVDGGIAVIATDTLYGVVGRADLPPTVERIFNLKGRHSDKPLLILIARVSDVEQLGVIIDDEHRALLNESWPGPVSVVLPCPDPDNRWAYLHRGVRSLAFRMPAKPSLRRLIAATGPLVAPSANPQGMEPARTIGEARQYFGDRVDAYRRGQTNTKPSRLLRIDDGGITVLRD